MRGPHEEKGFEVKKKKKELKLLNPFFLPREISRVKKMVGQAMGSQRRIEKKLEEILELLKEREDEENEES